MDTKIIVNMTERGPPSKKKRDTYSQGYYCQTKNYEIVLVMVEGRKKRKGLRKEGHIGKRGTREEGEEGRKKRKG